MRRLKTLLMHLQKKINLSKSWLTYCKNIRKKYPIVLKKFKTLKKFILYRKLTTLLTTQSMTIQLLPRSCLLSFFLFISQLASASTESLQAPQRVIENASRISPRQNSFENSFINTVVLKLFIKLEWLKLIIYYNLLICSPYDTKWNTGVHVIYLPYYVTSIRATFV